MKKVLAAVVILSLLVLFGGTIWFLWNKARRAPVVYRTEAPTITDIVQKTVATGSIVPRREVAVKPRVSGIVESIKVEAGQKVRRGDLLATIRVIPQTAALAASESRVNIARIRLEDAERERERNDRLLAEGVIPDTVWRQAVLARDTAKEELAASEDSMAVIRKGVPARSGDETNTLVTATMEGTVLDVPVKEGSPVIEANTFNDGTTIATLADMSELVFEGKLDESEVGKLRTGMDIELTIGAMEPARFKAVLEHIAPKGIEENGAIQFRIRAALRGVAGATIRANYSANAEVVLDRRDQVLALKESLLQFEGDKATVEVERAPQVFEKRTVKTGLSDGVMIEIVEGLGRNDRVKAGVADAAAPGAAAVR